MNKIRFIKALLVCAGLLVLSVQNVLGQEEAAVKTLQVVSFTEVDKNAEDGDDARKASNFAGKLKNTALIKVFLPCEIEATTPASVQPMQRRQTRGGSYAYYIWLPKNESSIRIVPKDKYQSVKVLFYEHNPKILKRTPKHQTDAGVLPGKVYNLVLHDPEPTIIETHLEGSYVTIDKDSRKIFAGSDGTIILNDLTPGDHTAYVYTSNGDQRGSVAIKAQEKKYTCDVRRKKRITITTIPAGQAVYIKDGEITDRFNPSKEYVYKSYKVVVNFNGNEVAKEITVDDANSAFVIRNTRTFNVTPMYNGRSTAATLFENRNAVVAGENDVILDGNTYRITRPIGESYTYQATGSDGGKSKKLRISVNNNSAYDYQLPIGARNTIVWPWMREYDAAALGVGVGYIQKQMVVKGEGEKATTNGVWADGWDKWLHGIQAGVYAQPCLSWGLGLYSGLFYEVYFSSNGSGNSDEYTDFIEHNLTIPVHALYRLPFGKKVALSVHGGLGFSYAVYGAYKAEGYDDYTDIYGRDTAPKRFNMALEAGLEFRVGPVQVGLLYSKGINDHKSYAYLGDYKTTYKKIGINVAWVINANE